MSDEFDDSFDRAAARGDRPARDTPRDRLEEVIPGLVAQLYEHAPVGLRTRLLECLLRPIGPLALVAVAAGAFGRLLQRGNVACVPVSLEDAARISSDQVLELARFVEDCNPDTWLQIGSLVADSPLGLATVGSSMLLLAIGIWRQHRSRLQRGIR